ncbi:MAG: RNA-binding protein [Pedobacter sp.]|nr:MAG: RNA-binding protein [Pedobacter sp.]
MRVFIANLDYRITSTELRELFLVFGNVTECNLVTEKENDHKSKGYGFISYSQNIFAEWAIKAMNEKELNGRKIVVRKAKAEPKTKANKGKRPRINVQRNPLFAGAN